MAIPSDSRYHSNLWRTCRRNALAAFPVCPVCESEHMTRASTVADHVVPVQLGLVDFVDPRNHVGLCTRHHQIKRTMEQSAYRMGANPVEALRLLAMAATKRKILAEPIRRALLWIESGTEWPHHIMGGGHG